MKKLAALTSTGIYFLSSLSVFAQERIQIQEPDKGFKTLGDFINKSITLVFIFAVLAVLVMLIWGAFEWITSGGDKDAVGKARGRILNALIGLAVLAVAFAIYRVAASFAGFNPLDFVVPTPAPR